MFFIPIKVELDFITRPFSNLVIIFLTLIISVSAWLSKDQTLINQMVLSDWNPVGIIGSMFLHGDILHLVFNMIFLFVFGNAVCSAVGNFIYPIIYIFLGITAGIVHLLLDGHPAIGASGAIAGTIGLVTVLFPVSKVKIFYLFSLFYYAWIKYGTFRLNTLIVGGIFMVLDLWGILGPNDGIAHFAHIGGFLAGAAGGMILSSTNFIVSEHRSLLEVLTGKKKKTSADVEAKIKLSELAAGDYKTYGQELLSEYELQHMNDVNKELGELKYPKESIPVFRIMRIMETEKSFKCFVVNEGDSILNIYFPDKNKKCTIDPTHSIPNGETCIILVDKQNIKKGKAEFCIEYNNSNHFNSRKNFVFDLSEKTFKIEEWENVTK